MNVAGPSLRGLHKQEGERAAEFKSPPTKRSSSLGPPGCPEPGLRPCRRLRSGGFSMRQQPGLAQPLPQPALLASGPAGLGSLHQTITTICSSKHFVSPLKQTQEPQGPSPSPAVGHQSSCQSHGENNLLVLGQALGGSFPGPGFTEQPLDWAPCCQPGTSNPASTQQP